MKVIKEIHLDFIYYLVNGEVIADAAGNKRAWVASIYPTGVEIEENADKDYVIRNTEQQIIKGLASWGVADVTFETVELAKALPTKEYLCNEHDGIDTQTAALWVLGDGCVARFKDDKCYVYGSKDHDTPFEIIDVIE